jgi:hypothetical protein
MSQKQKNSRTTKQKKNIIIIKKNKNKRRNNRDNFNDMPANNGQLTTNVQGVQWGSPKYGSFNGDLMVTNREFITQVPPTDTISAININAGLNTAFPWLSTLAQAFEMYQIRRLDVCFLTSSPSLAPGVFAMSPEFNVLSPLPTTLQEFYQNKYATRVALWQNGKMRIKEPDFNFRKYFLRPAGPLPSSDLKTFDPMLLLYTTFGSSEDLNSVGEIWFEYDVVLINQQAATNITMPIFSNFSKQLGFTVGISNVLPFGTAFAAPATNAGNLLVTVTSGTTLTFNQAFQGLMTITMDLNYNGSPSGFSILPNIGTSTAGVEMLYLSEADVAFLDPIREGTPGEIIIARIDATIGATIVITNLGLNLTTEPTTYVEVYLAPWSVT